jgi:hypothetical protein
MATDIAGLTADQQELVNCYEQWLSATLKSKNTEQSDDIDLFVTYISSALVEEDNSDEEKRETIRPFLLELNYVS